MALLRVAETGENVLGQHKPNEQHQRRDGNGNLHRDWSGAIEGHTHVFYPDAATSAAFDAIASNEAGSSAPKPSKRSIFRMARPSSSPSISQRALVKTFKRA